MDNLRKQADMTKRICSVEDCGRPHFGKGYCQMHAYRLRTNGDPLIVRPRTTPGAMVGERHPQWRGDDVEYPAVHARLVRQQGKASDHECVACGAPANDWAYQHEAADEKFDEKRGLPYSTNPDDYAPGKWRATATRDWKQYSAGLHDTPQEAAMAAEQLRSTLLDGA